MHYIKLQISEGPSPVGGSTMWHLAVSEVSRVVIPTSSGSESQEEDRDWAAF